MMTHKRKQSGIGAIGLIFVLISLAFIGLIGLKLIPIYAESLKIDKAISGVLELPDVSSMSKQEIEIALKKRLDIDDVKSVTYRNFKDHVTVTVEQEQVIISVDYYRETPFLGNISLIVDFAKRQES